MIEYAYAVVRVVWNLNCNRYDTLYYGGPYDFDGDIASVIWVRDYLQAAYFNDVDLCCELSRQIAEFYPDACCQLLKIRSVYCGC